jgi:transposase
VEDAAIRELGRARADALTDLKAAQGRLPAVFRRQDIGSEGRATGGPAPRRWLANVLCPTPAQQIVFQAYGRARSEPTERRQRLEAALPALVQSWRWLPGVAALQAVRGGHFMAAVPLSAALGALTRCANPRPLMSSLGRIPSTPPRGQRRRPGSLTQTGTSHPRRVLVEDAWASRSPAQGSRPLQLRLEKVPQAIPDLRWQAQR